MSGAPGRLTEFGAVGRSASRFEPLRTVMLAVATAFVVLAATVVAATLASYAGWDARSVARSPIDASFEGGSPEVRWDYALDTVAGSYQADIVYLDPRSESAAPPPGVASVPAQGEVYLAPQLARDLAAGTGDTSRYGKVAGLIGSEGLVDPGERIAYVGAQGRLSEGNSAIASGFGTAKAAPIGAMSDRKSPVTTLGIVAFLVVVPALWFFVAALRVGAEQRARRLEILGVLGARRRQRRQFLWGESRRAWSLGAGVGLAMTCLTFVVDVPLRGVTFTLQARDMRAQWWVVGGCAAVALAVTWLACRSRAGLRNARPRASREGTRRVPGLALGSAGVVVACLTVIAENLAVGAGQIDMVAAIVLVGGVATLALLPLGVTQWVRGIGRWARGRSWEAGSAAGVAGAAQIQAHPRPAARCASTAAIVVVILCVLVSTFSFFGKDARDAQAYQRTYGTSVARVVPYAQQSDEVWLALLETLRSDHAVAAVTTADDGTTSVWVAREDRATLGLDGDASGRSPAWLTYAVWGDATVRQGDIPATANELYIAARDGAPVDIAALRDYLGSATVPLWTAELLGDDWIGGALKEQRQARWLTLFGTFTILLSLLALWTAYANELLRAVRGLAPVQFLAPDGRLVRRALAWRVFVPAGAAAIGGSGIGLILCLPADPAAGTDLPVGFALWAAFLVLAVGAVAWAITVRACRRAGTRLLTDVPEE